MCVILLIVIQLIVILPNVILLNVVAPNFNGNAMGLLFFVEHKCSTWIVSCLIPKY
jgi:hypothetical protein